MGFCILATEFLCLGAEGVGVAVVFKKNPERKKRKLVLVKCGLAALREQSPSFQKMRSDSQLLPSHSALGSVSLFWLLVGVCIK